MKNIDAPLACIVRRSQPYWTSRQILATDEKANVVSAV